MVQHDSTILHCLFVCMMTSNHIGLKSENTMEWHPNIAYSFYVQLMNYDNLPGQFQGTWSVLKGEATKIGGMALGTVAMMGRMTGGTFWAEDIGNPAENWCWIHVATRDFSDPKPWYIFFFRRPLIPTVSLKPPVKWSGCFHRHLHLFLIAEVTALQRFSVLHFS